MLIENPREVFQLLVDGPVQVPLVDSAHDRLHRLSADRRPKAGEVTPIATVAGLTLPEAIAKEVELVGCVVLHAIALTTVDDSRLIRMRPSLHRRKRPSTPSLTLCDSS